MSDKTTVKNEKQNISIIYPMLRSFIVFFIISLIFIPLAALICYSSPDPVSCIEVAGSISLYISLAISGFICAKSSGDGLRTTLFYAVIMLIILMLAGLIPTGKSSRELTFTIIRYSIIPLAILLGGMIGGKKKKHKSVSYKNKNGYKKKKKRT